MSVQAAKLAQEIKLDELNHVEKPPLETDYSDWKSGNQRVLRRWRPCFSPQTTQRTE